MPQFKALGGTGDILPEEAGRWQKIESGARQVFTLYGYQEIRTPLIEEAAVFTSSLGEAAEIVTKQMYLFQDRGGRTVALRPEGTASVVRAFIEQGLDKRGGLTRWYYGGPMFRAERPQAGRRRQFHQIGVEVFGSASPYQDADLLLLLGALLGRWGVAGWTLNVNTLGCRKDRAEMVKQVIARLKPKRSSLCGDCQVRLEKNPLRILDCKEKRCQEAVAGIDLSAAICRECADHFAKVVETLTRMQLPFRREPRLVRGLDYYTRTAFEVIHPGLGAQNALGGGGRYDDLVAQMGGAPTPAIGFAVGLERVVMAQEKEVAQEANGAGIQIFVATLSPGEIPQGVVLAEAARRKNMAAVSNVEDRPLKRQLEQASKWGCRFVVMKGEAERAKGVVAVKDMEKRTQVELPQEQWLEKLEGLVSS